MLAIPTVDSWPSKYEPDAADWDMLDEAWEQVHTALMDAVLVDMGWDDMPEDKAEYYLYHANEGIRSWFYYGFLRARYRWRDADNYQLAETLNGIADTVDSIYYPAIGDDLWVQVDVHGGFVVKHRRILDKLYKQVAYV